MSPSELVTEAVVTANKVGQAKVGQEVILARGKRLYQRKRLSIHQRFMGIFYREVKTFTLTSASNLFLPTNPSMIAPILVETQIAAAGNNRYVPVKPADQGNPDSRFGWSQIHDVNGKSILFTQAGDAAGNYRLTYLGAHAVGDNEQMVLPDGYEDVLVWELAGWLRFCYEEDSRTCKVEARELENEADEILRLWTGKHPSPGLTNG